MPTHPWYTRHLEISMSNSSSRTAVKAAQVRSQEKSYLQMSTGIHQGCRQGGGKPPPCPLEPCFAMLLLPTTHR